jgi:hypothetical protein
MSTPNYTSIPLPTFVMGNQQDILEQLLQNLVTDATDPTSSNFCLTNSSSGQTITTPLLLNPVDGDPDDNTTNAYNNNRVATRKWCKNAYITNVLDPHVLSTDYTFTGIHVHNADLRVTADPANNNSVVRKSYLASNYQPLLSSGSALSVGNITTASITDNGNVTIGNRLTVGGISTFNNEVDLNGNIVANGATVTPAKVGYLQNVSSDIQGQLNGKQATLTAGSVGDSLLASTFVKPSTAPILTGTNFTGIPESAVTNLTTDLAGKQATIGSTTDLSFRNLTATGTITFPAGSISDATLASSFVKPSTAPILTGTNFTGIPESAVTNLVSDLAAKQDTLTAGSVGDSLLASTFVKPSTAPILTGTNFTGIPESAVTNLVSDLAAKQDTLTAGSVGDSLLASTFVKPSTVLTGTNFTGIPESAVTNLVSDLAGKQATLTAGSVGDSLLASTFVKPSTAPILTGTNFTNIPKSAVTNLVSDLAGKQATLTTGSVTDAMLASTFVKPSTAAILTGTNFTGIPTSAISSGALVVTSLTCTSETDSGNAVFGSISEKYNAITTGTNSFTLDYSTGAVFYLSTGSTLNANFSVRLNNCTTDTTKNITFALIYSTTGKYYCSSVTAYSDTSTAITLASSTPIFSGGTPSISTSTIMVQTFTLTRLFASNYVLSSVVSYY